MNFRVTRWLITYALLTVSYAPGTHLSLLTADGRLLTGANCDEASNQLEGGQGKGTQQTFCTAQKDKDALVVLCLLRSLRDVTLTISHLWLLTDDSVAIIIPFALPKTPFPLAADLFTFLSQTRNLILCYFVASSIALKG
eukprot:1178093-Prorocentrum_minimum.AAC.3